jgi:protein CpxP
MNRLLLYRWSIALLLILNLVTLIYVMGRHPIHEDRPIEGGPLMIFRKLNLSDETLFKVEELGRLHHQKILELNRLEQDFIFKSLIENEQLEEYKYKIANIENQKIEVTRDHFEEIENLLEADQKENFSSVKKDLIKALFGSKRPPTRHP